MTTPNQHPTLNGAEILRATLAAKGTTTAQGHRPDTYQPRPKA